MVPAINAKKLFIAVTVLGLAVISNTQAVNIIGRWSAEFDTQVGIQKYIYEFKQEDDQVTGKANSEIAGQKREVTLQDVKLEGDTIKFTEIIDFQGEELWITYEGKISDNEIDFTRIVGDFITEKLVARRVESTEDEAKQDNWRADTMWNANFKLERVIIGEVDSKHKGSEVVALTGDGRVAVMSKIKEGWDTKVIWKGKGELVGAAIGDLEKSHEGNEVFVGGVEGTVEMICPDSLLHLTIFDKGVSIHGLALGDVMESIPGEELIVVDNSGQAFAVYKEKENWQWEEIFKDPLRLRDVVIEDFDSSHEGNEALIVGSSGNAVLMWEEGGQWNKKTIWASDKALARVTCGIVGDGNDDIKIAIAADTGETIVLEKVNEKWSGKTIYKDDDKLRGIAIGDIYPLSKGNEIAIFGYSKKVIILYNENNQWNSILAWTDTDRAHSLACGEFDSSNNTEECAAAGYSKMVTMISYNE